MAVLFYMRRGTALSRSFSPRNLPIAGGAIPGCLGSVSYGWTTAYVWSPTEASGQPT